MSTYSSPVPVGCRYTSGYGNRTLGGRVSFHAGSDYAPPKPGQTGVKLYAISDGVVLRTGTNIRQGHSGKALEIDHGMRTGNGSTDRMVTYYGHVKKFFVKKGERVRAGQLIAEMGRTDNVTNVHVHIGVLANGRFINPHRWLATKGIDPGKTRPVEGAVTHTVQSGDTLSKIGKKYGVKWRTIATRNNIKGPRYTIYPGNKLIIK